MDLTTVENGQFHFFRKWSTIYIDVERTIWLFTHICVVFERQFGSVCCYISLIQLQEMQI